MTGGVDVGGELGEFRLLEFLGAGGAAEVFRARRGEAGEEVAVKVLRPDASDEHRARFAREARLLLGIEHPNVVPILELHVDATQPHYVMPLLDAVALSRWLPADPGDPPRDPAARLAVVDQVLAGLEYVHARGILHRDIKPSNVLVTPDGHAYLADFGLAFEEDATAITQGDEAAGTFAYLSPEQFAGEPLAATADLYQVGLLLHELVTGVLPYPDTTVAEALLRRARHGVPAPGPLNPSMAPELEAVLVRALASEPGARFPDAASFRAALADLPPAPFAAGAPASRGLPRIAWLAGAALLLWGGIFLAARPAGIQREVTTLRAAGDLRGARTRLELLLEEDRSAGWARHQLVEVLFELGDDAALEALLESPSRHRLSGGDSDRIRLAVLGRALDRADLAGAKKALEDGTPALEENSSAFFDAAIQVATLERSKAAEAAGDLAAALEEARSLGARRGTVEAWLWIRGLAARVPDADATLEAAVEAFRADPGSTPATLALLTVLQGFGWGQDASLLHLLVQESGDAELIRFLAGYREVVAMVEDGQVVEAGVLPRLEALRERYPDFLPADFMACKVLGGKDPAGSRECLRGILAREPTFVYAYVALVTSYKEAGDLAKAEEAARAAVAVAPRVSVLHSLLAYVLLNQGRFEEAATLLREVIEKWPYLPGAHLDIAQALDRLDREPEAIELLEAYLAGPGWVLPFHVDLGEERHREKARATHREMLAVPYREVMGRMRDLVRELKAERSGMSERMRRAVESALRQRRGK